MLKKIGCGAEGTVYKALDIMTNTPVAIKEIRVRSDEDLARIQETINLVTNLSEEQPNICKILAHIIEENDHQNQSRTLLASSFSGSSASSYQSPLMQSLLSDGTGNSNIELLPRTRKDSNSGINQILGNFQMFQQDTQTSATSPHTPTASPLANVLSSDMPFSSPPMTPVSEYQVFLVMEYCDASMDQLITDYFEYISLEQKLDWIRQAAQVLEFLHNKFIVHRDIKPQNFLLKAAELNGLSSSGSSLGRTPTHNDQFGLIGVVSPQSSSVTNSSIVSSSTPAKQVSNNNSTDFVDPSQEYTLKLVDFGFTKQSATMMKSFAGTPIYMSPECYNTRKYDVSTDIWSFGMVILRLTLFPVRCFFLFFC